MCRNHPGNPYYSSYSYSISSTAYSWAVHAFVYLLIFIYSLNWLRKPRGLSFRAGCCGGCQKRGGRGLTSRPVVPAGMALSPACYRYGQRPVCRCRSSRSVSPVSRPSSGASAGRRARPPPAPVRPRSRSSLDQRRRFLPISDPFRFRRSRLAKDHVLSVIIVSGSALTTNTAATSVWITIRQSENVCELRNLLVSFAWSA